MANIEGDDTWSGTRPLTEDQKEDIRMARFSALQVADLAYGDPVGCLHVLSENSYLNTGLHRTLLDEVIKHLPAEHQDRAETVQHDIDLNLTEIEGAAADDLALMKVQFDKHAEIRAKTLKKWQDAQDKLAGEANTFTEIGTSDEDLSTAFDLGESSLEALRGQVSNNVEMQTQTYSL